MNSDYEDRECLRQANREYDTRYVAGFTLGDAVLAIVAVVILILANVFITP